MRYIIAIVLVLALVTLYLHSRKVTALAGTTTTGPVLIPAGATHLGVSSLGFDTWYYKDSSGKETFYGVKDGATTIISGVK